MKRVSLFTLMFAFGVLAVGIAAPSVAAQTSTACGAANTTAAILRCEDARYEQAQKDLQKVYFQLSSQLDSQARMKLSAAETAWLRFRDATAEFQADAARGGSLAPVLRVTTRADMTEARELELKKLLHEQPGTTTGEKNGKL